MGGTVVKCQQFYLALLVLLLTACSSNNSTPGDNPPLQVPKLVTKDQQVEAGDSLSYRIQDQDIQNIKAGSSPVILVTSATPRVSYNPRTKTFFSGPLHRAGRYTVTGTISDGANTRRWSFNLTVQDRVAPQLNIPSQTVEVGERFSFTIEDSHITHKRPEENVAIQVTSTSPQVTYDSSSRQLTTATLNTARTYSITGTISDGTNSNPWSFSLTVQDTIAPQLNIPSQTVEAGERLSFSIEDSHITSDRSGESFVIEVTSTSPQVTYNSSSRQLTTAALNTARTYSITGTISDGTNTSNWSFQLTVQDTIAPQLTIPDQTIEAGEIFLFQIQNTHISNHQGETAPIIQVTSTSPQVTYNSTTEQLTTAALNTARTYSITGTISDGTNSNPWSFSLTVQDTIAPQLNIPNQTVEVGERLSFSIEDSHITSDRSGESFVIQVTSTSPQVTYDSSSRQLTTATLNTARTYSITGTISDGTNTSNWSFSLIVQRTSTGTAPQLNIPDQSLRLGQSLSFKIQSSHISNLASEDTATIVVTSTSPLVVYNATTEDFTTAPLNSVETHTVTGTISNGTDSSNWSFDLEVRSSAPQLNIPNQTVEAGKSFTLPLLRSYMSNLNLGEIPTIALTSTSPQVTYNSTRQELTIPALNTLTTYNITGTISYNSNSTNWSFSLTVQDSTAPQLRVPSQNLNLRESLSVENLSTYVTGLRSGETFSLNVTSLTPGVTYNSTNQSLTSNPINSAGVYNVSGRISDGTNTSNWSFPVTLSQSAGPVLNMPDQTMEAGTSLSLQVLDSHMAGIAQGETPSIVITSTSPGVTYNSTTQVFTSNALHDLGSHIVKGTITHQGASNHWAFQIHVQDTTAPTLNVTDQTSPINRIFSYNFQSLIDNNRPSETITITPNPNSLNIRYRPLERFLQTEDLRKSGSHVISGTISDGTNTSNWSFTLTSQNLTPPLLSITNQTILTGSAFSHQILPSDITDLRHDETAIINVTSTSPEVTYNSTTQSLSSATISTAGTYPITGTISNGSSSSNWSFNLKVVDELYANTVPGCAHGTPVHPLSFTPMREVEPLFSSFSSSSSEEQTLKEVPADCNTHGYLNANEFPKTTVAAPKSIAAPQSPSLETPPINTSPPNWFEAAPTLPSPPIFPPPLLRPLSATPKLPSTTTRAIKFSAPTPTP